MENNATTHNKSRNILLIAALVLVLLIVALGGVLVFKNKKSQPVARQASQLKAESSIYFLPETINPDTPVNATQSAQLIVRPQSEFNAMSIQFKFNPQVVKQIEVIPTQYKNEKLKPYTIKSSAIDYEHGLVTLRFNESDGTGNMPLKRGVKVADIQYQLAQPLTKATSLFTFTGRTALIRKVDTKAEGTTAGSTNIQSAGQIRYESILNSAPPLTVSQ